MTAITTNALLDAATRLYTHLLKEHWNGQALAGPDSGIRFNARAGRFIKSYLSFVPWRDTYTYAQTQKYWVLANWLLADLRLADERQCQDIAIATSEYLLSVQRPEGYWNYPNPEWSGRIATVEGNYASIAMLETYLRTKATPLLEGGKKWYHYAVNYIGFQEEDDTLAINYFGNVPGGRVPNNSASALRTFALLAKAAGDDQYLDECRGMVAFVKRYQTQEGELPYSVRGVTNKGRVHFLCYQYNAFEFLNLVDYYHLTQDQEIWPVLEKLAPFVAVGVTDSGAARYNCYQDTPEVPYYTAAVGAALSQATDMGLGDYRSLADRAYERVLSQQRRDGSFFFSRANYRFLSDKRSYPRNQAMLLVHLLLELKSHLTQAVPEPVELAQVEQGEAR